jgi:lysophospholipase L1-like esterase
MTMTSPRPTRHRALAIGFAAAGMTIAMVAPAFAGSASGHVVAKHHKKPKASSTKAVPGSRYLALGDSVPFGYRESQSIDTPHYTDQRDFVGYPEEVAANLGLKLTNAACPGETSASFLNVTAQSNGCENNYTPPGSTPTTDPAYRTAFPLHTKYKSATQTQMAFAVAFLKAHRTTRLVTLTVGANDGLICQKQFSDGCVGEIAALQKTIAAHMATIYKTLRTKAKYTGQIVLVPYYSFDYTNSLTNFEIQSLNAALEKPAKTYHVRVADSYGMFQTAAANGGGNTCTAGLLTALNTTPSSCGIHPSRAGAAVLAQATEQAVTK